jgi:hypothetical protein
MIQENARLYPGDLVEVKGADEILQTLDGGGAMDHLPFMPEMLEFCGKQFRVSQRVLVACFSGAGSPRGFRGDDVVTLDGLRCSGTDHDGCQKACMIFWREAWLRKVDDPIPQSKLDLAGGERLRARLKTSSGSGTYYCQASELSKAANSLSVGQRIERYFGALRAGNFNALQMAQGMGIWLFWRIRRILLGVYPRGSKKSTTPDGLNLQPGEWVEIKPLKDILDTLNESGYNRGLRFSPDMRLLCGQRRRVQGRLDRIIVDGTGAMRQLRNTVCLEGSTCGCAYMGFGMIGCSRCELVYWRETWLRRCGPTERTIR